MRVQYIKSGCVLIEHAGKRVLCDPWLSDGAYYGSWYHYPPVDYRAHDFIDVDYIFISHIHPDHLDVKTLLEFPREIFIIILEYQEKPLLNILKKIKFTNVIEVPHKQKFSIGDDFTLEV